MSSINFYSVIDISSVIWDKKDFDANKHQYYKLLDGVSMLFMKLKKEKDKTTILLRNGLLSEMVDEFPYESIKNDFWTIGILVYSFLANIGSSIKTYSDKITPYLVSIPNLVKAHYNSTTKNEVCYLISKIHSDDESQHVYFTFQYLWDDKADKLKTKIGEETQEYETIISDKGIELEEFFAKFEPIFEHNRKHDKSRYKTKEWWEKEDNKNDFISQLSCYNGNDNERPQELLSHARKSGENYISYDVENEVWVVFSCHLDNKYHGYDEYDKFNCEKIPNEVRKHFNI